MPMLYVKTAKGKMVAYDLVHGKAFVGQEDLFDILERRDERKRQEEADDWADNGFDDGEEN